MIDNLVKNQKDYFKSDITKSYAFRHSMLEKLLAMIIDHESMIMEALQKDLNKSEFEAYSTEVGFCKMSIRKTLKQLKKWMKTKKVKTPFIQLFTKSYVRYHPKGTVLIIGPYNYPFQLIIEPLIGAIAAGNTAVIKPSEFTTHTEATLEKLINKTFDADYIHVVTGDKDITQALLKESFDHIFFTGSTRVGQIVYEAASKHLTPVTLELGGKSPAIIDGSVDLTVTAKRIAFGKFMNAGQTCIAPDYLYIKKDVQDEFLTILSTVIDDFYADKTLFGRIVNDGHFKRIVGLIDKDKLHYGGNHNAKERYIEPTVLKDVTWDDAVMKEEIFGPVLPVMTYDDPLELVKILKTKERPLALYVFSKNKPFTNTIFTQLEFGGGAINDTVLHVANPYLPFGGTGASGIGVYHGKHSFETFSHPKAYIKKSHRIDPKYLYPPYKNKVKLIKKIMK